MRLGRKPPATGRRRRQPAESGQAPPPSLAYRSRRSADELNTGRQVQTDREPRAAAAPRHAGRWILRRFGLIVLLAALLVSAVNMLTLSSNVRLMSLSDGSASSFLHDQSAYQAAASDLMADSIWNRNKLTVNTAAVSQGLLKQFPELSSASVTLPLFSKRPIVYIQTDQPALILAARNGSFVIGSTGKALLPATRLPANSKLQLPVVTDQSGLEVRLNHQALTSDSVNFIQTVLAQLKAKGVGAESLVLPVGTSELDLKIAGQPYTVKFNLESGTAREQSGTFLATKSKLESQHIIPAQYIDVRLDGRAYYK
jgi:hypothetical protein